MQKAYKPEASILRHRAELSNAFSALRSVRPRVPFWHLAAHRIPTLWSLYRGILKYVPGENIRWRMRTLFDRYKCLTSPKATRAKLLLAHKFLDSFRSASEGDERLRLILSRYDSMIAAKRAKEEIKNMIREQVTWQERLRNRPIMTGGFLRPSVLNGPLPRLKPQPTRISMMLRKRQLQYGRIGERYARLLEDINDLVSEKQFEEELARKEGRYAKDQMVFKPTFANTSEWNWAINAERAAIRRSLALAVRRARTPYPSEMLEAIKEARREKIRNKIRERERERRGEVLRCTIERRRKRPPPHILATMSAWRRHADKVIRGVSEVGYVGMMKSRMGVKMKNPTLWRELEGEGEGKGPENSRGQNAEEDSKKHVK